MATVNVGKMLDEGHWGGYQKLLIAGTALTIILDGVDNQLLPNALPRLIEEWQHAALGVRHRVVGRPVRHDVRRCGRRVPRRSLRPADGAVVERDFVRRCSRWPSPT